jgi:hypothetical protein
LICEARLVGASAPSGLCRIRRCVFFDLFPLSRQTIDHAEYFAVF